MTLEWGCRVAAAAEEEEAWADEDSRREPLIEPPPAPLWLGMVATAEAEEEPWLLLLLSLVDLVLAAEESPAAPLPRWRPPPVVAVALLI